MMSQLETVRALDAGRERRGEMGLTGFLLDAGYVRVALGRTGLGHFHTAGTLNGRPVAVLIDTGAASSVFSLDVGREIGMVLEKSPMQGGGAGAARMEIFLAPGAVLRLGEIMPKVKELLAMDLTHVNEALALHGERPVDVILGADVFDAQAAVIDYGSNSLFLRP